MQFKDKFKHLRKRYDLTQDQIADIFHVAPQTVSRWETGVNYPDIEILPHIAIFFKVSIDELLGVDEIRSEEKTIEYKRDIRNLLNSGKVDEAINTTRKAMKEYPTNYDIQAHLVQALCVACTMNQYSKEEIEIFKKEIIKTSDAIINYSTEQDNILWTKFQLLRQYVKWGMKKEAEMILKTLPSEVWYTQDANAGLVLEGNKWQKRQELSIKRFSILLCNFIDAYAQKAEIDKLHKIECLKLSMQITDNVQKIIKQNDDFIAKTFLNVEIAKLYCEVDDTLNALEYIEKAVQNSLHHIHIMDKIGKDGSNYFAWPTKRNLCWILLEDYLMKQQFDSICSNERFIKCLEVLKANSKELD